MQVKYEYDTDNNRVDMNMIRLLFISKFLNSNLFYGIKLVTNSHIICQIAISIWRSAVWYERIHWCLISVDIQNIEILFSFSIAFGSYDFVLDFETKENMSFFDNFLTLPTQFYGIEKSTIWLKGNLQMMDDLLLLFF